MSYHLNTTDSSINIHVNSEDAVSFVGIGADSSLVQTSDFIIMFDDIISCDNEQNMLLSIQSIEIPTSYYNVSAAIGNNVFQFKEGTDPVQTITMPSKNYSVDDVVADLPGLLNVAGSGTYTCSYDDRTLKFTITGNTSFVFDFSDYRATAKLLGFLPQSYSSGSSTIISATPANMNTIPFAFLETNFSAEGSIITTSNTSMKSFKSGVLLKIPLNSDFANVTTYQPINKHHLVIQRKRFHNIRFTLKDSAFRTIDMNAVPISLTMTIDFVNFDVIKNAIEDTRDAEVEVTRDDVNELISQSLMEQGRYWSTQFDQRNRLINLLELDERK